MSLMSLRRRRAATKGFNLIEAAIVLGIVGLVVGGIWVAATSVYANLRSKEAADTLLSIVQGTRALFATSSTTGLGNGGALTPVLAQANVLPSNTLGTTAALTTAANTVNSWGGAIGIWATQNSNLTADSGFQVQFTNVPSAACVDFLSRNTGVGRDSGMYAVTGAAAGASAHVLQAGNLPVSQALPINTITGNAVCNVAAGGLRNVSFYFNLRG